MIKFIAEIAFIYLLLTCLLRTYGYILRELNITPKLFWEKSFVMVLAVIILFGLIFVFLVVAVMFIFLASLIYGVITL